MIIVFEQFFVLCFVQSSCSVLKWNLNGSFPLSARVSHSICDHDFYDLQVIVCPSLLTPRDLCSGPATLFQRILEASSSREKKAIATARHTKTAQFGNCISTPPI